MNINLIELDSSTDFFKTVLDNIHSALLIVNKNNQIKAFNKHLKKLVKKEDEELYERSVGDILDCEFSVSNDHFCGTNSGCDHCQIRNSIIDVIYDHNRIIENRVFERNLVTNDNENKKYYKFSTNYIRYQNEDMVLLILDDITDTELQKEKLEEQNKKLIDLNQQKNRFLSIASHDLRNPVAAIQACSSLILQNFENPEQGESKKLLEIIYSKSQYALNLISDLLDYSKIESGKIDLFLQNHNYEDFVCLIIQNQQVIANSKNIRLSLNINGEIPDFKFDRNRIEQVINNLLDNAFKYSPDGSEIKIEIHPENDFVVTKIIDHGPGIPENELTKIFEAFHKVENSYTLGKNGTGLGLAIVKKIIESHKGHVEVKSKLEEGSAFIFKLPVNV